MFGKAKIMNKPIFLLLGGNKLNYGIMKKFQENGYRVFVVDWNDFPQLMGDKHYKLDVKNAYAIIEALKNDDEWNNVKFAYSSIDLAVTSVAKLNRAIGLKTITDEGLKYASSKSMMTKKWNEVGLLNRLSRSYTNYKDEIEHFNKEYKLIIKPDNSASSRGITVIERSTCKKKIIDAFNRAKKEATDDIVVVEEFVEGTEFTVEMLGDSHGNVCVYAISKKTHTNNTENNKIAIKLHYNSVDDELQKKIAAYGIACYRALGFSSTLGHLEILVKEDGTISPVEIGARSSGFIASDLVDIVSGESYLDDLIRIQNGEKVLNGLHPQINKSSMYFFYDFPAGTFIKNVCNMMDFCDESIISRYNDRSAIIEGKKFDKISNDNARWGFEILEGPKNIMTHEYITRAEEKMLSYMLGAIS